MGVLDRDMEHGWYRIDFNAIPQRQHEVGLDSCEGFTDWACNDDTVMYQHTISAAPYTQSFNPSISTSAGTEQSNDCSALSSPSLCEALPCQKEKVCKPSLYHSLSKVFWLSILATSPKPCLAKSFSPAAGVLYPYARTGARGNPR